MERIVSNEEEKVVEGGFSCDDRRYGIIVNMSFRGHPDMEIHVGEDGRIMDQMASGQDYPSKEEIRDGNWIDMGYIHETFKGYEMTRDYSRSYKHYVGRRKGCQENMIGQEKVNNLQRIRRLTVEERPEFGRWNEWNELDYGEVEDKN